MKISVALCTYNGEVYLAEQLDSILNQSEKVDEIVICDDVSTDRTLLILQTYQKKYPHILKVYQNESNLGYIKNFENAIKKCNGDIIFLSDQDDFWSSDKVEKIIEEFRKDSSINVVTHDLHILSKDQKILEKSFWQSNNLDLHSSNKNIISRILLYGNIFPGMSLAISSHAKKYLPFLISNRFLVHDLRLIIKSCNENRFKILPLPLSTYRLHDRQNIGYSTSDKTTNLYELYIRKNSRAEFINILNDFDLNPDIVKEYDKKTVVQIQEFLKSFGPFQRLLLYLKIKYYYKLYP